MEWDSLKFLGPAVHSRLQDCYKRTETVYFAFDDVDGACEVLEQCMSTEDFNLHGMRLAGELLQWQRRVSQRATSLISTKCVDSFSHLHL